MIKPLPISVVIVTKNEEHNIARCIESLTNFDDIIVVDSHSQDNTCAIAEKMNATIVHYKWNNAYPKKRQWCLDNIDIKYDWVFWVDADEVIPPDLITALQKHFQLPPNIAGFFIQGQYIYQNTLLKFGLRNNKIALFHRKRMHFPVIDDLDITEMGEIEGHYQPILTNQTCTTIEQITPPLLHYAYENTQGWERRHRRYAIWEAKMNARGAWASDPIAWRDYIKKHIRHSALRPFIMFLYSYIFKGGILDGQAGYHFAKSRYRYCTMIREESHKLQHKK